MAKEESRAADIYELKQEIKELREQIEILAANAVKNNDICDAAKELCQRFGIYTDTGKREAIGLITRIFPTAGTIDLLILDSSYSGGTREVSLSPDPEIGYHPIGRERNQFMPFLLDQPEAPVTDEQLLAAGRG